MLADEYAQGRLLQPRVTDPTHPRTLVPGPRDTAVHRQLSVSRRLPPERNSLYRANASFTISRVSP